MKKYFRKFCLIILYVIIIIFLILENFFLLRSTPSSYSFDFFIENSWIRDRDWKNIFRKFCLIILYNRNYFFNSWKFPPSFSSFSFFIKNTEDFENRSKAILRNNNIIYYNNYFFNSWEFPPSFSSFFFFIKNSLRKRRFRKSIESYSS